MPDHDNPDERNRTPATRAGYRLSFVGLVREPDGRFGFTVRATLDDEVIDITPPRAFLRAADAIAMAAHAIRYAEKTGLPPEFAEESFYQSAATGAAVGRVDRRTTSDTRRPCFMLRTDDVHARAALLAYADSAEHESTALAAEVRAFAEQCARPECALPLDDHSSR